MITYRPLPFFNERKLPISMLVIHSMAHNAGEGIAQLEKLQLSAHYVVDYDGTVYQCVNEDKRAWHAGVAFWRGITDVNSAAIGIEVCHRSLGQSRFNRKQIAALTELCRDIIDRRRIAPTMIVGHSDVAPQRKPDPGKGFPWRELAAADVGIGTAAAFRRKRTLPKCFPKSVTASPAKRDCKPRLMPSAGAFCRKKSANCRSKNWWKRLFPPTAENF